MQRLLLVIFICFLSVGHSMAQKSSRTTPASIGVSNTGTGTAYYGGRNEPPRAMVFKTGTVTASSFLANINQYFNIPAEFTFVEAESNTDDLGMRHRLLQQYYKGILVEGMGYRLHEKGGFVTSVNGKAVRKMNPDMNVSLNEAQAFQLAARYVQTKDTTVRRGQKLIVSKDFTLAPESFAVAFQFDIDVSLIERWRISIDARNGQMLNKVSLVNSCREDTPPEPPLPYITGTGMTSYYGLKPIRIESTGSGSQMVGQTAHGGIISTYDFGNRPVIVLRFPFTPPVFTSSGTLYNDYYSQPAVSAQWAAEQAYEYYYQKHNRNSFDNIGSAIKSYVHVDVGWDNAMWTGKLLALGDGSNNNPLVELDVVSHELTHGVTQYEANLQYYNESGALNESFSDILGKAVEFDVFGSSATWQLGRHFQDGGIRDMSNPNVKNQPDTYAGDMWQTSAEDNGGVHTNSGVQNFWFYLLCKGGSGVNDHQVNYSVNAIGMDAAVKITYRNLTEYLNTQSDYIDSRIGSLLAAADLYGNNSTVYQEVGNAWDAVGVIDEPTITSLDVYDITATTVKIKGSMLPKSAVATYHFEYGPTPAYGSSTATSPYIDKVECVITGLQSETKYYLKLVATNENGSSYITSQFTTISLAPLVRLKQTADVTETNATLYGQINPNSLATSFYFEYGLTPALGSATPTYPLPAATEYQDISASIANLQPLQTYYYRLVATNGFATVSTPKATFFTAVKPVINSYAPAKGPIGTEITITGQHFNPAPENNFVSFGATRGTVLSSTTTQIKVTVPAGASLGPISVLDAQSGLVGESVREFVPTFTGEFKKDHLVLTVGSTDDIYQTMVQDMDGDHKPDIVARHYLGFSVFQNVNQGGDITEASFVRNIFNSQYNPGTLSLADLDGNGLKDVVVTYQGHLRIYPNLSAPGFIFFGVPVDLPLSAEYLLDFTFNDFDQDGRVDIALSWYSSYSYRNWVEILQNKNPKGFLLPENFVSRYQQDMSSYMYNLYSDDLNNDGKPDLLASIADQNAVPIVRNDSQPGAWAFVNENNIPNNTTVRLPSYVSHDLNGDGWRDIVAHSHDQAGNVDILENKETSPGISMAKTTLTSGYVVSVVQPADIDGDGAVDLVMGLNNGKFAFMKNNGAVNDPISNASFEKFSEYGLSLSSTPTQTGMTINDLNGDGRPDIINTHSYNTLQHDGYMMEIWQNGPPNCLDPSGVSVNVSNYTATIVLPPNTTQDQFEIDYTSSGGTYWTRVYGLTISVYYGNTYQLRVHAKCYQGYTDYYYIDFHPDCVDTNSFTVSSIGVDNVTISASYLGSFEVQYSVAGQNQWILQPQNSNQINNLLPGTQYDIRFRGQCSPPSDFKYKQFTTLCAKLAKITVTPLLDNTAEVRWSSAYQGNVVLEYSLDNLHWTLIDETLIIRSLIPGKQYAVRGRMACTNANSDFISTSFVALCPKVSTLYVDTVTPFSARVNWVDASSTGNYVLTYSVTGGPVTTLETHSTSFNLEGLTPGTPYTVAVAPQCASKNFTSTTFSTVCYVPFNLSADALSHTTADLSWDDNFDGYPYTIEYSISGSNVWLTTETASTTISLTGLRPGTKYEARVHIHCSIESLAFASLLFETELYDETTYFPNPTDGEITIHPSRDLIGHRFNIYDNVGNSVASGELPDYTIDLSVLAPGVYILRVDGESPLKIVKR